MYNRYVPGKNGGHVRQNMTQAGCVPDRESWQRVSAPDEQKYTQAQEKRQEGGVKSGGTVWNTPLFGEMFQRDKSGGMKGLLEALKLDDLDSGDVLLVLILLFLMAEGDNLELVITLGLLLLLGLGGERDEKGPGSGGLSGLGELF